MWNFQIISDEKVKYGRNRQRSITKVECRNTIEQHPQISIGDISKEKLFLEGVVSIINWSSSEESAGRIAVFGGRRT